MVYVSDNHGCAYRIFKDVDSDGDYLIYTPLNQDNTFSMDDDEWIEVDEMALLGEEQEVRDEVEKVWKTLSNYTY